MSGFFVRGFLVLKGNLFLWLYMNICVTLKLLACEVR